MDKLDAVNDMLSAIGEEPVNSLEAGLPDADAARQLLDRMSRQAQTRGWWFNTEPEVELAEDVEGRVPIPSDVLSFTPASYRTPAKLTNRGGFAYDLREATDVLNQSIDVHVIRNVTWDDLPEAFQTHAMVSAGRRFQDRYLGSTKHHKFSQEDETRTMALLMDEEVTQSGANMHTDSFSAHDILNRFTNPSPYRF